MEIQIFSLLRIEELVGFKYIHFNFWRRWTLQQMVCHKEQYMMKYVIYNIAFWCHLPLKLFLHSFDELIFLQINQRETDKMRFICMYDKVWDRKAWLSLNFSCATYSICLNKRKTFVSSFWWLVFLRWSKILIKHLFWKGHQRRLCKILMNNFHQKACKCAL